jgi:hypothetical protein
MSQALQNVGSRCHRLVGPLIVGAAVAVLLWRGFVPACGLVSASAPQDFPYFYATGKCLWQGLDPYDPAAYGPVYQALAGTTVEDRSYYPPTAWPLLALLGRLEPRQAMFALAALNLAGALLIAWLTMLLVTRAEAVSPASGAPLTRWLLPTVVLVSPAVSQLVFLGQVTLPAVALIMAGWFAYRQGRDLWAGLFFGLASYKPQFLPLFLLWLLLERRWRILAVTTAVALLLATPWLVEFGPWRSVSEWFTTLNHYHLSNWLVMGLPSVLVAAGLPPISPLVLLLFGALLVVLLWTIRQRLAPDAIVGLIAAIHLLFLYGKYVESVLSFFIVAGLWLLVGWRRASWPFLLAGLLITWIPTRLFLDATHPALNHPSWNHVKMAGYMAGSVALFVLALRPRSESRSLRPPEII